MSGTPLVRERFRYVIAAAALVVAAAMVWHHYRQLTTDGVTNSEFVYAWACLWLLLLTVWPYFHRDVFPRDAVGWARVNRLKVLVVVPVHNEDPALFLAHLNSLAAQTRLPRWIHVVENGYPQRKLEGIFNQWRATSCPASVEAIYSHNLAPSKREAQAVAVRAHPDADVIATIDSDMVIDSGCIANGIAPFVRRQVMSVCGLIIGKNVRANLLTRLIEPSYVCSFLGGRASFGMLGCVAVNGGALSWYRGWLFRKYLHHYLTHKIAGRSFSYGDDAMMTRYALMEGEALFQSSAWGYTVHPVKFKHLAKQRTRWWRSFFWGNLWGLRAFSPAKPIWWLTAWKFTSFAWYTVLLPVIAYRAVFDGVAAWDFVGWLLAIGVFAQARYLSIRRPGESIWSQLATVSLTPLGVLLNVYICWVLQYVGLFTCLKTGWGTRKQVEVGQSGQRPTSIGEDGQVEKRAPNIPVFNSPATRPYDPDATVQLPRFTETTVLTAVGMSEGSCHQ